MQDRERMPIEFDPVRRGYWLTERIANFPLLQISEGEIVALFIAQKALAQHRGSSFEQPLRLACDKLMEGLKGTFSVSWGDLDAAISFRNFETNPVDIKVFKELSVAVQQSREVNFDYWKLGATAFEKRSLRPYHLTCANHQWYVLGHDIVRGDIRTFLLSRMQTLYVLATTFIRPETFSAEKYLKGSFGVFSGDKPVTIRIWFDSFASRLVRERTWHTSQKITLLANDETELELTLTSTIEISSWILSWGNHAKVIAPLEFADAILLTLKSSLVRYEKASSSEKSAIEPRKSI